MNKLMFCACLGLLPFSPAHAEVKFTGELGIELGGDELGKAVFSDGDSAAIKAGDGLVLDAGLLIPLDQRGTTELALTVGWKFKQISATNGDISITRFPIEATLFRNLDQHRLGLGAAYHSGIKIDASGAGNNFVNTDIDLTSELGYILRYDYFFSKTWGLGAKYTGIKYKASPGDETVDASSFGLMATARF